MAVVTSQNLDSFNRAELAKRQPMDHGELNVPLAKRGSIDAELDKYHAAKKSDERIEAQSQSAQNKANKATAKTMAAEHLPGLLEKHGANFGAKALAGHVDQLCKWDPEKAISLFNKYKSENGIE
jgi:hypothetical protein